jgi:hypothetical protein
MASADSAESAASSLTTVPPKGRVGVGALMAPAFSNSKDRYKLRQRAEGASIVGAGNAAYFCDQAVLFRTNDMRNAPPLIPLGRRGVVPLAAPPALPPPPDSDDGSVVSSVSGRKKGALRALTTKVRGCERWRARRELFE